jgi:hypothetical protein
MNSRRVAIATATAIFVTSAAFQTARADDNDFAMYKSEADRLNAQYDAIRNQEKYRGRPVPLLPIISVEKNPDGTYYLLDKNSGAIGKINPGKPAAAAPTKNRFDQFDTPATVNRESKPREIAAAESVQAQVKMVADEMRKSLPMMVGEDLQETDIAAIGTALITGYRFTRRKSEIPNLDSRKARFYRANLNSACTHPDLLEAFRNGASINYQVYDSASEFIMQFTIDAETCRKRK